MIKYTTKNFLRLSSYFSYSKFYCSAAPSFFKIGHDDLFTFDNSVIHSYEEPKKSKDLNPQSTKLYDQLLKYDNSLELYKVLHTLKDTKHIHVDHVEYSIYRLAKDNHISTMRELIDLIILKKFIPSPETYANILISIFKMDENEGPDCAFDILKYMNENGVAMTDKIHQIYVNGFSQYDKNYSSCLIHVFALATAGEGILSRECALRYLYAFTKHNQLELLYELLELCPGIEDVHFYNCVIKIYSEAGDIENVQRLDKEMEEKKIEKNDHTLSLLANIYKYKMELFDEFMGKVLEKDITGGEYFLSTLLHTCLSLKRHDIAHSIFHILLENDQQPLDIIYKELLEHYSRKGDRANTFALAEIMTSKKELNINHYHYLCDTYLNLDEFELFDVTMEVIAVRFTKTIESYHLAIRRIISDNRKSISDCMEILDEMNENRIIPTIDTYSLIITGFCAFGEMQAANNMLNIMESNGIKPTTKIYTTLVAGYKKTRKS